MNGFLKWYQMLLRRMSSEVIVKSFEACGVAAFGKQVPIEHLNGKLRDVLGYHERLEEMEDGDSLISPKDDTSDMELDIQD